MANFSFLTCLSVTSQPNSEKLGFHYLPRIYLIVQFQHMQIIISELLTHTPHGKQIYQVVYSRITVHFVFSHEVSTYFQSCLSQPLILPPSSVRLVYSFVIPLHYFCHILHYILRSSNLLNAFLNLIHKVCSLCCKVLCILILQSYVLYSPLQCHAE